MLQKAASLSDGGGRAFLYTPVEKESTFLAYLVGPSGALSGLERPPFSSGSRVALDRGEAQVEQAGRLSFSHAPLYGANYLLAEVFRVGSHPLMIACGSIFMLTAIKRRSRATASWMMKSCLAKLGGMVEERSVESGGSHQTLPEETMALPRFHGSF